MQLPHIDKDLAKHCEKNKIEGVPDLIDMDDAERAKLLGLPPAKMAEVALACNSYPDVELKYNVQNSDKLRANGKVVVSVSLERDPDEEDSKQTGVPRVSAPRYPQLKTEGWWLIIGNPKVNELISVKRVAMKRKKMTVNLDFAAPNTTGEHKLMLYFMSDSYLGCDQEYEIPLKLGEAATKEESESESESESRKKRRKRSTSRSRRSQSESRYKLPRKKKTTKEIESKISRSSSSSSELAKRSRSKSKGHPSYKYMITEAIYEEKKYVKGSSISDIRRFILEKYIIDQSLKDKLNKTLSKMCEDTDQGWSCLKKVDDNYKLSPEWRKSWCKQFAQKIRRKKKPSDYPKNPRNAYLYFSIEVRKKRQEEYPDRRFGELTTMVANEWKNLKSTKKKKYEEMAKNDRARFKRELQEWQSKHKGEESESESSS